MAARLHDLRRRETAVGLGHKSRACQPVRSHSGTFATPPLRRSSRNGCTLLQPQWPTAIVLLDYCRRGGPYAPSANDIQHMIHLPQVLSAVPQLQTLTLAGNPMASARPCGPAAAQPPAAVGTATATSTASQQAMQPPADGAATTTATATATSAAQAVQPAADAGAGASGASGAAGTGAGGGRAEPEAKGGGPASEAQSQAAPPHNTPPGLPFYRWVAGTVLCWGGGCVPCAPAAGYCHGTGHWTSYRWVAGRGRCRAGRRWNRPGAVTMCRAPLSSCVGVVMALGPEPWRRGDCG